MSLDARRMIDWPTCPPACCSVKYDELKQQLKVLKLKLSTCFHPQSTAKVADLVFFTLYLFIVSASFQDSAYDLTDLHLNSVSELTICNIFKKTV